MNRQKKEQAKNRCFAVKKAGKFLEGHSYATGIGSRFFWAESEHEAIRMERINAVSFALQTGGRVFKINL